MSDDERREVAERLRRAWANVPDKNSVRHHMRVLYEIYAAVGLNDDGADAIDLFDRLADLIEPGDMSQGRRDIVACDRDALLALADEMDKDGRLQRERQKAGERWFIDGLDVRDYARRIREALGVSDD